MGCSGQHYATMKRIHLQIFGRVQGVGFRYSCYRKARALKLTGWVRNREDNSVEVVAEGPADAVDALAAWCRQGPVFARVERVAQRDEPARGDLLSFEIRDAW